MLNIYHIETANYVNGNGCRYVLWLQRCDLGCKECWNQQTWSFENKILKSVDEIFGQIKSLENIIDGVTFSGGEPFLQAPLLTKVASYIKKYTKLDIQIFTGFERDELVLKEQKTLLQHTDILVAGRYDASKMNNNQKVFHFNKNVPLWEFNNSDIEIELDENCNLKFTGYPTNDLIQRF